MKKIPVINKFNNKCLKNILGIIFLLGSLTGCIRTAVEFEVFQKYDVEAPKDKKNVELRHVYGEDSVYGNYCYLKSNDLISYTCSTDKADYIVGFRDKSGTWEGSNDQWFLLTLLSLGLIPTYDWRKNTVEMIIYDKLTGTEIITDLGTEERTTWYGWIPLFIPNGSSYQEAKVEKSNDITANIAHHIYDPNSIMTKLRTERKKEIDAEKKRIQNEIKAQQDAQDAMLERLRKRSK